MARTKTAPTKTEAKLIGITINSHPDKLVSIEWDADEQGWAVAFADGIDGSQFVMDAGGDFDLQSVIADAIDFAAEQLAAAGEAGDLGEDDEAAERRTIVPHKYRNEYKARGDARSCGDWLALTLRDLLNGGSKKNPVDLERTYALARANGCAKQWGHLNPGQQRMNAGNAIRRSVKTLGYLVVPASMSSDGSEQQLFPN